MKKIEAINLIKKWETITEMSFIASIPLDIDKKNVQEVLEKAADNLAADAFINFLIKEALEDEDKDKEFTQMMDMAYDISEDDGFSVKKVERKGIETFAKAVEDTDFDLTAELNIYLKDYEYECL